MTTDDLLRDDYDFKKRAYFETRMQLARLGINADPSVVIRCQDLATELLELEALLGVAQSVVVSSDLPYRLRPRIERATEARETVTRLPVRKAEADRANARQKDIEAQNNLLRIHRANLAHYRAQAKAFGGVDLAMPITRHGITEERASIARVKDNLRRLGAPVDDLPGDE